MKIKLIVAFIALYCLSLILTAPASMLIRFIPENAGIQIAHVSGTVWQGKIKQLDYRNQYQLQNLTWKFDWSALFLLKLKAYLKFDNGPTLMAGKGSVAYGFSGFSISDAEVEMAAAQVLPYLQLPMPITANGKFNLVIENASAGLPYCHEIDGYLVWHEAKIGSQMGDIDFATPSMDLSCEKGNLLASLTQNSEQLTTNANIKLSEGNSYSLEGTIKGGEKLAPSILQALTWIGPKSENGETAFNLSGKL